MIPPKFAADVMLGKLAKWLRLLGLDTFYSNRAEDAFLKELSKREERILLTRDLLLHQSINDKLSHLVLHSKPKEQLAEVISQFHLQGLRLAPRCSVCNGEMAAVEKSTLAKKVPPYVFKTQDDFSQCRQCGKIYWPGTHLPRIRLFLDTTTSPRH